MQLQAKLFHLLLLVALAKGQVEMRFGWTSATERQGKWTKDAGPNKFFNGLDMNFGSSDRVYKFKTAEVGGMEVQDRSYTGWVNKAGYPMDFSCGANQAICGIESDYWYWTGDRQFKIKCCDLELRNEFKLSGAKWTGFINGWKGNAQRDCGSQGVLVGMQSEFYQGVTWDRRWKISCRTLYRKEDVIAHSTSTDYLNNWAKDFQWSGYSSNVARNLITGLSSYHDNWEEDRRFKILYSPRNLAVEKYFGWTHFQNEADGNLDFKCPTDSVLTGLKTKHDDYYYDRIWAFECVEIKDHEVKDDRDSGFIHDYDEKAFFECNGDEVMVGLRGVHDDWYQDRRLAVKCAKLKKRVHDCDTLRIEAVRIKSSREIGIEPQSIKTYSNNYNGCGSSTSLGTVDLDLSFETKVSKSETLKLAKSLEHTFEFSTEHEVSWEVSQTTEVTASASPAGRRRLQGGSASTSNTVRRRPGASATTSNTVKYGQKFTWGTKTGYKTGINQETTTKTTTEDVEGVTFKHKGVEHQPFEWWEFELKYYETRVQYDIVMTVQCLRKEDGELKKVGEPKDLEAELVEGVQGQFEVEFHNRTPECKDYQSCQCIPNMSSSYIAAGCTSEHPRFKGSAEEGEMTGCYVAKTADNGNCGNQQGLNSAKPLSNTPIGTDLPEEDLKKVAAYLDWPLNPDFFEWSYKACGHAQFREEDIKVRWCTNKISAYRVAFGEDEEKEFKSWELRAPCSRSFHVEKDLNSFGSKHCNAGEAEFSLHDNQGNDDYDDKWCGAKMDDYGLTVEKKSDDSEDSEDEAPAPTPGTDNQRRLPEMELVAPTL